MTVVSMDCLDGLKILGDNTVDAIVTDPPYGLAFMGKRWDYDVPKVEVWVECLRVLKPGGHLLAFAGTRTQHRMACRIEDAGFEIRDLIAWVYGSGFPKSHNGEWGGTALKPALEPITMARKPLVGTVEANWREYGTGALNINGCRVGDEEVVTHGGAKKGTAAYGDFAGMIPAAHRGRWPANLVHDGSDEVLAAFPEGASRFFYCAKASKRDRDEGLEGFARSTVGDGAPAVAENPRLRNTIERQNTHPTVKPTDLMRYLCRLVTPPGGLIVDPFTGSGSTGKAARLEGFEFLGFELDPDYAAIATARIDAAGNSAVHSPARNPE